LLFHLWHTHSFFLGTIRRFSWKSKKVSSHWRFHDNRPSQEHICGCF
jgi:hypothetical protein